MPPAYFVFFVVNFAAKGYSLPHDVDFILGALTTPKALMGHVAIVFWIWRLWPPAWEALWHGPYLVTSKEDSLFLPRNKKLALSDITAASVHRGFWTKVAVIETLHDRVSFAADFITESSDQRLRELAPKVATA